MNTKRRRGSVLLLVVGLLTIIAMLGGTFLVIARSNASAVENTAVKQIADGMATSALSLLMNTLQTRLAIEGATYGPFSQGTGLSTLRPYIDHPVSTAPYLYYRNPLDGDPYSKDLGGTFIPEYFGTSVQINGSPVYFFADTDFDGQPDAYYQKGAVDPVSGMNYWIAVSVADLSGKLNANVAGQPDGTNYGRLYEVNLQRSGTGAPDARLHESINTLYPSITTARGSASLATYYTNAGRRLFSPVSGLPYCIADEICLRDHRRDSPSSFGRMATIVNALADNTVTTNTRHDLTVWNCSRKLVRHPNAQVRKRLSLADKTLLENTALRQVLYDELKRIAPASENGAGAAGVGAAGAGTVVYVDDGDAGWTYYLTWGLASTPGFQGDCRYSTSPTAVSRWDATVPAGRYKVAVTWPYNPATSGNNASNSPFQVYDGTTAFPEVRVSQKVAPADFTDTGTSWKSLGEYEINSGTLIVRLRHSSVDGPVVADAIRVEAINDSGNDVAPSDCAAHYLANLWAALYPHSEAEAKAFAVTCDSGTVYGLINQPVISEAYAVVKGPSAAGATDWRWGMAVEIFNPTTQSINLARYWLKGLQGTPGEMNLTGTLAPNTRRVYYSVGGGAAPTPQDVFGVAPTADWIPVTGGELTFVGTKKIVLERRVADNGNHAIPADYVETTDLDLQIATLPPPPPADGQPPVEEKKDCSRDDNAANQRCLVAAYNKSGVHTLGLANTSGDLNITVNKGFDARISQNLAATVPTQPTMAHLLDIYMYGPNSKGEPVTQGLRARADKEDRGKPNFLGQVNTASANWCGDLPLAAFLAEWFDLAPGDDTRATDDPQITRVYGRININTANAVALRRLPWPSTLTETQVNEMVMAILRYRDELIGLDTSGTGQSKRGVAMAVTDLRKNAGTTDIAGFLTPGEIGVPLAQYWASKITDKTAPDYLKQRDATFNAVVNCLTTNSDTYAVTILVGLGKEVPAPAAPQKPYIDFAHRWSYLAILDRSNCWKLADRPAILLFCEK